MCAHTYTHLATRMQAVRANVNRAAAMLDEVLNDILQELLVDQAASYLTEESPELNEMEVSGWHPHVAPN